MRKAGQAVFCAGVFPACTLAQAELPLKRDEELTLGGSAWVGLSLLVVVAAGWAFKRRSDGTSARRSGIIVESARSLTTQTSLHVVEWEGERLLVACNPSAVTVLARRPHEETAS